MNLYHLETLEGFDYDEHDAFVVAAPTAPAARKLVAAHHDGWGPEKGRWTSARRSSCALLGSTDRGRGIIIASFNAG